MSKKVKTIIIVIVIIILVIAALAYFGNNAAPVAPDTGLTSSAASTGTVVVPGGPASDPAAGNAANFSSLLSSIDSITLNTSIFTNPAYEALVDNPVILGTAVIGRQDPFAPIGTDAGGDQPAPLLQLQTLAPGKIISNSAEFGALVNVSSVTPPISVVFQYGTSDTFGSATAPVNVTKSGTALLTVTGLIPSTTYYVEAVAVQGSVTATGSIMSFTTTAALQ